MSSFAFEGFLSTPEVLACYGETAVVQAMMDFEAALAHAEAAEGLIPLAAAQAIAGVCKAELYDVPALIAASGRAGSLAIPLVKKLTETVALFDADAARYVHWGGTSQDVIDTAMVLVTRRAWGHVEHDLGRLVDALLALAERHGDAPVLARTLMQPAQVVSFGLKLATWTAPLVRAQARLAAASREALALQFGGAVGTLSVLGDAGPRVAARVAERLALRLPPAPWHTQRDVWVQFGCELGVLVGSLGKIARDWSLQAQGEVGELAEPSGGGRGGSSAMPHKRNPVSAMVALAAAQRVPQRVAGLLAAMGQEQERGLGNWQAELAEWAGLWISAHGAVKALADAAAGLEVDPGRMLDNIERLHGLVAAEALSMQLARVVGKAAAHHRVEAWSQQVVREGRHLRDVAREGLRADPALRELAGEALDAVFDPAEAAAPARHLAEARLQALRAEWARRERAAALDATPH